MKNRNPLTGPVFPGDDLITPFRIEGIGVRGRVARLGPLVNEVLTRHDYPEAVSVLLGELLLLCAMLGTALKFEGRLSVQTRGDGPVSMLVVDYEFPGRLRGYAHLDQEAALAAIDAGRTGIAGLMGKGHMALTLDQGGDMDRYQGITELRDQGLASSFHEYFAQSEQIATQIRPAVARFYDGQNTQTASWSWRAGAIMIQHVPGEGGMTGFLQDGDGEAPERFLTQEEKNWEHAAILLGTVEDHELLDPHLQAGALLMRLFHEDGVRVYPPGPVSFGCRCSHERMVHVLRNFSRNDLDDMAQEGRIETTCRFCNQTYAFDRQEFL